MTGHAWLQAGVYFAVLLALVKPLGWYMARVYECKPCGLDRVLGPLEQAIYRLAGRSAVKEMTWKAYALAMLLFNFASFMMLNALQRVQAWLPLNPQHLPAVSADSAFNTAVSFASNTNWQSYSGETTLSYLTQMLGLTVQNFLSAAAGMAVLVALIRAFTRHPGQHQHAANTIGNFWVDLTRSTLYILLPLSVVLALALGSQGVVQTLRPYQTASLLEPGMDGDGKPITEQTIALGPAASQVAIKQLGTNGGGFFNVNSSHPLENPTPLSNFLEMLAILLISSALCYTFGEMVKDRRQGWALLAVMLVLLVPLFLWCWHSEAGGNPRLARLGVDQAVAEAQPGGNMEGKEVRFGVVNSALWACATTAASNGSVNSMHDSFTPLGGLVPMLLMQLGEVVFGGVGSGLYGLLLFAIIAVFVAGLMVGRTPEYLGKKIESYEMKMASLGVLVPCIAVLLGTAVAVALPAGKTGVANPGAHGFSEILYAFSSAGNNNGSAFAGLSANTPFYNLSLGIAMLLARYWVMIPVLAIAGSLVKKKKVSVGPGTLPTHTPLFVVLLAAVVMIVGALTFFPALALGPIVEHLLLVN
ncbi:MAG: potassium-transporting ATPase subunit KdpA [Planctomycetota bacterium]